MSTETLEMSHFLKNRLKASAAEPDISQSAVVAPAHDITVNILGFLRKKIYIYEKKCYLHI